MSDNLIDKGFERVRPELTETELFFEQFKDVRVLHNEEFPELRYYPTIEHLYQMFKSRMASESK